MKIDGYLPTSLIEWPGKITAVVFTPGCNFRCPFCHNKDLVDPKHLGGSGMVGSLQVNEKEVFDDLKKRRKWIDGVVITGGEPTLHEDLPKFLGRCKRMRFETMVETNGSRPKKIAELLNGQMVDYLAMDIKAPLDKNYGKVAGLKDFDFTLIQHSIKTILNSGVDFEFRTTVVPTIHNRKSIVKMARQLDSLTAGQPVSWFLQSFQPKNCFDSIFNKIKPYLVKEMEELLEVVQKYIPGVELRGV